MLPLGHRLSTLGAQMPLLGRFGDSLKFHVFLEGSRYSLLLENDSKMRVEENYILTLFWYLFPEGTPLHEKYPKSNIFHQKIP